MGVHKGIEYIGGHNQWGSANLDMAFSRADFSVLVDSVAIPAEPPVALTEEFAQDSEKAIQWKAFVRRSRLEAATPELHEVIAHLREFLLCPMSAALVEKPVPANWTKGGPWS